MTSLSAFAAVDLGASSGRVVLGLPDATSLALIEVHRFTNGALTEQSRVLWDVGYLFEQTLVGLAKAASEAALHGRVLAGIGVES